MLYQVSGISFLRWLNNTLGKTDHKVSPPSVDGHFGFVSIVYFLF